MKREYLYIAGALLIFLFMQFRQCKSDNKIDNLIDQVNRYNDTTVSKRQVDGKTVTDAKGSVLTLEEFERLDAKRFKEMMAIIGNSKPASLGTVRIEYPQVNNQPVHINYFDSTGRSFIIPLEDSCQKGFVARDSTGKTYWTYKLAMTELDIITHWKREKWYKARELQSSGVIKSPCGEITLQRVTLIADKPKWWQKGWVKVVEGAAATLILQQLIK